LPNTSPRNGVDRAPGSVPAPLLLVTLALLTAACASSSHRTSVPPSSVSSTSSAATTTTSSVGTTTSSSLAPTTTSSVGTTTSGSAAATTTTTTFDLHEVDWNNVAVPGASCMRAGPIQLHNGQALLLDPVNGHPNVPGSNGPRYDRLELLSPVRYGPFERAGYDEALVSLYCNNNGGTASGALRYSIAVFSPGTGEPVSLGLITAQKQPRDVLPTLLSVRSIAPGTITVVEAWYGPRDLTCCPGGRAITTWTYRGGKLVPVATVITTMPSATAGG